MLCLLCQAGLKGFHKTAAVDMIHNMQYLIVVMSWVVNVQDGCNPTSSVKKKESLKHNSPICHIVIPSAGYIVY